MSLTEVFVIVIVFGLMGVSLWLLRPWRRRR